MVQRLVLKNFRIIDETMDICGSVIVERGRISGVLTGDAAEDPRLGSADMVIDGSRLIPPGSGAGGRNPSGGPALMPALADLHAHFRDPGFPEKETLESASLAAVAGGYGTVVCMANTNPVIDTPESAAALKARSDALGLIDLYPVLSLTRGMAGTALSDLARLEAAGPPSPYRPRLLSEDGRDVADDALFLAALAQARRLGIPVSCHCDAGGAEAAAAKQAGQGREMWSRIEENAATRRAIALGRTAGAPVHIAHVSTAEAVEMVRAAKAELGAGGIVPKPGGFTLTAEATPHHIALTGENARVLGAESHGRVNPPLRTAADREAVIAALLDGTIDAIATDHAPHTEKDKAAGAPGFTGLETAFAVCRTELVREGRLDFRRLSALMSASPARILGLTDRGRVAPGLRADLIIVGLDLPWIVEPGAFRSRGKNSPFIGQELRGRILMTIRGGSPVFAVPSTPKSLKSLIRSIVFSDKKRGGHHDKAKYQIPGYPHGG